MPLVKSILKSEILRYFDAVDGGTEYDSAAETLGEAIITYSNPIIYAVNGKPAMDSSFKAVLRTSRIPSASNGYLMVNFADWLAAYTAQSSIQLSDTNLTAAKPFC